MSTYEERPKPKLPKTVDCTQVLFRQLNSQKIPISMSMAKMHCDKNKLFLHLGTDPNTFNNKPTGLYIGITYSTMT